MPVARPRLSARAGGAAWTLALALAFAVAPATHGDETRTLASHARTVVRSAAPTALASYDARIAGLVGLVSEDRLRTHTAWLEGLGTRYFTTSKCAEAATGILQHFQQLGLDASAETFSISGYSLTFRNIVATKPGKTDPAKVYIIGAHYDSTARGTPSTSAPGADDNASGTAAVMEIARVLSTYTFDFTIKFIAFAAEEPGYYGSAYYARAAQQRGEQILGVINLDMIGYVDSANEDLDLGINSASRWLADRYSATAQQYVARAVRIGYSGESDHESFWERGYSAILVIEDDPVTNPNYHRTADTVSTLDFPFLADVTRASLAVVADLAQPIAPASTLTVSGISPSSGTARGGTAVTVTGTNFVAGETTMSIGGAAASGVFVSGPTSLTATTPAHVVGPADVVVTNPGGQTARLNGGFTFIDTNAAPFGVLDTPLQQATGVMGSIAVTGWALDDAGVSDVKLYRNCLGFEPPANCAVFDGVNLVYLGTATFVAGARPDVEAAYPGYPQASRAGWGYMMLTNLLPHLPSGQMHGGQGSFSFYAIATDTEGRRTFLGRSPTDHTPTAVTLNNDAIAKPFGAIDTPAQGATVGGTITNFGWALTPDGNTTGGEAGDILIPVNGSTIWVFLDGVPVAPTITFNQCRGNNGSPKAGWYCNDDVSNIYGNVTPQALYATRTSNLTKFRNLDEGRAPIGFFSLDTRTLTNGLHQIVWSVTDSANRTEGIGSRYFTVLNTGTRPAAQDASDVGRGFSPGIVGGAPFDVAQGREAPPYTLARASSGVTGRTGFDVLAPLETVVPDADGVRHVQLPPLGRIELWLGPVDVGYLVAPVGNLTVPDVGSPGGSGAWRELPAGSHLDPATGRFTWAPGPAFLGTYHLVFVQDGAQVPVAMTIQPPDTPAPGASAVRMNLDEPQTGATLNGAFVVAGWALDPQAAFGGGIGAVHVWAQRRDVPGAEPEFLGQATLGGARPDVAAVHGARFHATGFGLLVPALPPGQYDVVVFVWSQRTQRWEDARTVAVTVR